MKNILLSSLLLITIGCSTHSPDRFNTMAADDYKNDKDFIPFLKIKKGFHIADIGSGGGYFSYKFSPLVGKDGKVFSVDINSKALEFIKKTAAQKKLNNLITVKGSFVSSNLKLNSIDLIFLRNTYHDISNRITYFTTLKKVLKKNGRIAILDYDPDKLNIIRKRFGHQIKKEVIKKEMNKAGYKVIKEYNFLKKQSFTIFIAE